MRVGLVGCSGTGSCVLESSIRNIVGEVVVIEPDGVENKNLNRLLGGKARHVGSSKAKYAVEAVFEAGLGTKILALEADLAFHRAVRAISTCDVVFGCMDSVTGRHLLNLICTYYSIPYFDLGVTIHADGKGGVDAACATSNYLRPGHSTLLTRGVYTSAQLEWENLRQNDPKEFANRKQQGYIKGINIERPAVFTLNNLCASLAYEDFLARLQGYRIDKAATARRQFSLVHDEYFCSPESDFEPYLPWREKLGRGDNFFLSEAHRIRNAEINAYGDLSPASELIEI